MHDLVQLKGTLKTAGSPFRPGPAQLPAGSVLSAEKVSRLRDELTAVNAFFQKNTLGFTPLVDVRYASLIPKSKRISKLFFWKQIPVSRRITGARLSEDTSNPVHIITYSLPEEAIRQALGYLAQLTLAIQTTFHGVITSEDMQRIAQGSQSTGSSLAKSLFMSIVRDIYFIDSFALPHRSVSMAGNVHIITLYQTGYSFDETKERLGFQHEQFLHLDDSTWVLDSRQLRLLMHTAPYLIAMEVKDWNSLSSPFGESEGERRKRSFPYPSNEPTIGVIDTPFDSNAYFSQWVESHDCLELASIEDEDRRHGTEVTSLIVDGPGLNPELDDGCGHFRVRHFGVCKANGFSSSAIIHHVTRIIAENPDIKVWNISLGSDREIERNSMSPEASILDELQTKYDVIFVIAGTNIPPRKPLTTMIGAPADSLNSLVVGAVDAQGKVPSYSRRGPVLGFFTKPDVCAIGGDRTTPIQVYNPMTDSIEKQSGTSFAAPWITRKLAYLIHVIGLTREAAKALLIDAAGGWNPPEGTYKQYLGHGVVPQRIEQVLQCRNDEIRFIINGVASSYETYAYTIPVPSTKGMFPYIARFTLCYTPHCSRLQGIDYPDTECNLKFGRMNGTSIESIDTNRQGDPLPLPIPEKDARSLFRKWDNVKHYVEACNPRKRAKKLYSPMWGFSIKKYERLDGTYHALPFSLVCTLKALDGRDRYDEFVKHCEASAWFTHTIDIQAMLGVYHEAQEELHFDES